MPDDQSSAMMSSESQALAEGQRLFGKYILRRFLGRGPLGAAWLVMDEGIGREMAMRFLPAGWARDERIKEALQAALGRWRELAHPHIVTAQNAVSEGAHAAIITRFVDGETLQDLKLRQEERCFPVNRIAPWMAQLCDALDYAWRHHQMVHGDINPLNLLITTDDSLRVADFGLARSLFDLKTGDGSPVLVGTLAYISPERARGATVTMADDVYAFGATVYDAVTGRPAFFRGNILWQLESVVPPTMNERRSELGLAGEPVPPQWEEVVAACLAKKSGDRPRSIREVGERLGLLEPMLPMDLAPSPIVLPRAAESRPAEYYTPHPGRKTEPAEIYPSSLATAGMEPMTMAGISHAPEHRPQEQPAAAENPLVVEQMAETDVPSHLAQMVSSSGGNQPDTLASNAPTDTAPWATPLAAARPEIPPEGEKEIVSATNAGGPEADSAKIGELPISGVLGDIPEAADTAKAPAEMEPPKMAVVPPPSVVAIPPMDPGLELTLPQYPTVGRVALPTSASPPPPAPPPPSEPAPAPLPQEIVSVPVSPAAIEGESKPAPLVPPPLPPKASSQPLVSPRTTRAIPVTQTPAQPRPSQPTPPPPPPRLPGETDTSGKRSAPKVPASSAARIAAPSEATSVPPTPNPKRRSYLLWIIGIGVAASIMAIVAVMMFLRRGNDTVGLSNAVPTPVSAPVVPREPTPQPIPAASGRTISLNQVADFAGKGKLQEELLLVGELKVVSAQPPTSPEAVPGAILRPTDPSLSGTIRVVATFRVGATLPKEGTVVQWSESDRAFVRSVVRREDGQLNVEVSHANRQ